MIQTRVLSKNKFLLAALSIVMPGLGHIVYGRLQKGLWWLAALIAGGSAIYYGFGDAPVAYYSAFGFLMAILATRDVLLLIRTDQADKEEPVVLKPESES